MEERDAGEGAAYDGGNGGVEFADLVHQLKREQDLFKG